MTVEPFSPQSLENPYPVYAALQDQAPVREAKTGIWLVSRHDDVVEAAGKPEVFSSHISALVYAGRGTNPAVIQADPEAIGAVDVLATQDPPAHTAQRRLVARAFAPSRINALDDQLQTFLVEALGEPLAHGSIEWMEAVANPLPVSVIGRILGLPPSDDNALREWADAGVELLSGVASPERIARAWQLMVEFVEYLRDRLTKPAPDTVAADVAEAARGGLLSDREAVSLMLQFVIAGSESTASLLGAAACMLADDDKMQAEMRNDPTRVPVFIEEALRLESPFRGHFRVTTRDADLGGVRIPAGERVMLMWGAANRDPRAFSQADACLLDRELPKGHVAFGSGIHFCIGAPLARHEATFVISRLLARTSRFSLAGPPKHVPSVFVRRLSRLELVLEPA